MYLGGPISGYDLDERRRLFGKIENCLSRNGYEVFNPLKNGLPEDALKMDQGTRDFLYTYAKRDIAPLFGRSFADGSRPCGAENFDQFLACFDKDNRYMVTAVDGERTETAETYLYNGHYWTSGVMRFEDRCITKVEKI